MPGKPLLAAQLREEKLREDVKRLKAQLAAKAQAPTVVVELDAMDEDSDEKSKAGYSLDQCRTMLEFANKTENAVDIAKWTEEIAAQTRAKHAAKPASQQIRIAEQSIQKLEKRAERLDAATADFEEAIAAAKRKLEAHRAELSQARTQLEAARVHKAQLAHSLSLSAPSSSSLATAPGPCNVWKQLLQMSSEEGVYEAITKIPGNFGMALQVYLGKIAAEKEVANEKEAAKLAAAEAAATEADTTAAASAETTAPTPHAPAATASDSATAAAPATTTSSHIRPPPLLEGATVVPVSSWPDGSDVAPVPVAHGRLSDEHYDLIAGTPSSELPALLAKLRPAIHAPY